MFCYIFRFGGKLCYVVICMFVDAIVFIVVIDVMFLFHWFVLMLCYLFMLC